MKLLTTIIFLLFNGVVFAQNFTWTQQNSGVTTRLRDVYFTDIQTGWVVGDEGVILSTTNGGINWNAQISGTSERLSAVFFINATTGWICGGFLNKTILKTTDGGSNWVDITPDNIVNSQLVDIAFANENTGWVINTDLIYITNDGGTTWTEENYQEDYSLLSHKALAVTSDSTAYVAGKRKRPTSSSAYADVFNKRPFEAPVSFGASVASEFNSFDLDNLKSIAFASATAGYAGGELGIIYKLEAIPGENNLSGPWNKILDLEPANFQTINSISFPTEDDGMFSTSVEVSGNSIALIYNTSNAGADWATPDSIPDLSIPILFAPDPFYTWVVGLGGKIYKGVSTLVGINDLELTMGFSVYPNPTTGIFKVEIVSENNETINYLLIDASGREIENGVWNLNGSTSLFSLDLSDSKNGMYLLKISTTTGQSVIRISKN